MGNEALEFRGVMQEFVSGRASIDELAWAERRWLREAGRDDVRRQILEGRRRYRPVRNAVRQMRRNHDAYVANMILDLMVKGEGHGTSDGHDPK